MILLDTNVLSEPLRSTPSQAVIDWIKRFDPLLVVPTIALAELALGSASLEPGARRTALEGHRKRIIGDFAGRVVAFDIAAAESLGEVSEVSRRAGRPMSILDSLIAAIALANRYEIATRNVGDFAHLPLKLINPWTA